MHAQDTRLRATPIAVITVAVDGSVGKFGFLWEPVTRPEEVLVFSKAPCLYGTTTEAVHEDNIYKGFWSAE